MVELLKYGFTFHIYQSYLSSFNDWQSRLIIARCLTFVAPFRAQAVFLGFSPLFANIVVKSLWYGCQFWTVCLTK